VAAAGADAMSSRLAPRSIFVGMSSSISRPPTSWDIAEISGDPDISIAGAANRDESSGTCASGSQSDMPSRQANESAFTYPAESSCSISAAETERWSPSPTLTVQKSSAEAPATAAPPSPSLPDATIEAPHFLHLILTVLPRTFSSAIVYFAAQA
jgi:hypothetical protein